jgi:hypothetical protein
MRGADLHRIGIKVFVADPSAPRIRDFVPVFHSWIQKQCLEGHLLIDVHDYSHIHHGPGILLVAHEGNISMDVADGRPGLLYYRKQPLDGALDSRVKTVLRSALQGCSLLEGEAAFEGKLRFRTDEFLFVANDRLLAPNSPQTFSSLQAELSAALDPVLGKVSIVPVSNDPKERFAVRIQAAKAAGLKDLLKK